MFCLFILFMGFSRQEYQSGLPFPSPVDFPGGSDGKSICLQCGRPRFDPWIGKIPWRREWQPPPVFSPGESHAQRSLVGHSPWGVRHDGLTFSLSHCWPHGMLCSAKDSSLIDPSLRDLSFMNRTLCFSTLWTPIRQLAPASLCPKPMDSGSCWISTLWDPALGSPSLWMQPSRFQSCAPRLCRPPTLWALAVWTLKLRVLTLQIPACISQS